jgi:hypothetical protein
MRTSNPIIKTENDKNGKGSMLIGVKYTPKKKRDKPLCFRFQNMFS